MYARNRARFTRGVSPRSGRVPGGRVSAAPGTHPEPRDTPPVGAPRPARRRPVVGAPCYASPVTRELLRAGEATIELVHGDSLELLKDLEPRSIDVVVPSPP